MAEFDSQREAKEYLVSKIVAATRSKRPPGDLLRLWLTVFGIAAFGIVFGLFVLTILYERLFGSR